MELKRQLAARPPVATQIWFVDRMLDYYKFSAMCDHLPIEHNALREIYPSAPLFGVQVFNIKSTEYVETMPTFCMVPGIWAVMSDGSVKWLTDPYAQESEIGALTVDKNAQNLKS